MKYFHKIKYAVPLMMWVFMMTSVVLLQSGQGQAQGFQTLEDKYGKSTPAPIQTKVPDTVVPQNSSDTTVTSPAVNSPLQAPAPVTSGQQASSNTAQEKIPPGMVYIGGKEWEIEDMLNQISRWTGKQFMYTGIKGKVTIISDTYMPVDMAVQLFYSALESNGLTTYETPSGVVRVIKQEESKTKPKDLFRDKLVINGDQDALLSEKIITRVIQPKNISANEVHSVVKEMISKAGSSSAYPATNSIIITDVGSNIDHILKLVKELDTSGPQEDMELIQIVNADAKDIADKIKTIFEVGDDESAVTRRSSASTSTKKRTAGAGTELQDVQAISRVIADERTNTLIIMGTKRMIVKVKSLISRLDTVLAGGSGTIHVYNLRYANAEEIEETLSKLVSGSSSSKDKKNSKNAKDTKNSANKETATTTTPTATSNGAELEGGVKIVADKATNQLIITASPKDYATLVEQVISKLDVTRPAIYLEATIMSMDVNKASTIGLSGLFGGILGNISGSDITGFASVASSVPLDIGSIAAASGGVLGGLGAVSDAQIEFTDSQGNAVRLPSATAVLQALQTNTDVNVLSQPQMLIMDNEEAKFTVGLKIPTITGGALSTNSVQSFNVEREETGLKLIINPQISDGNTIRLKIEQEISDVISTDDRLGPTLSNKSVETTIVAQDKQTVVIAGLMDDKSAVTVQKVPLLGDIPVLGNLFKTTNNAKTKSNLLIFITPYVVRESSDGFAIMKKKIDERNAFMQANLGKGQQKRIREAIRAHAESLLEFTCNPIEMNNPCFADSYSSAKEEQNSSSSIQGGSSSKVVVPAVEKTQTAVPQVAPETETTVPSAETVKKNKWDRPTKKK